MCAALVIFLSERLNAWLGNGEHWKAVASRNYFDPHGAFLTLVLLGPLLAFEFLLVVLMLYNVFRLMVTLKEAHIRARKRKVARMAREKAQSRQEDGLESAGTVVHRKGGQLDGQGVPPGASPSLVPTVEGQTEGGEPTGSSGACTPPAEVEYSGPQESLPASDDTWDFWFQR